MREDHNPHSLGRCVCGGGIGVGGECVWGCYERGTRPSLTRKVCVCVCVCVGVGGECVGVVFMYGYRCVCA